MNGRTFSPNPRKRGKSHHYYHEYTTQEYSFSGKPASAGSVNEDEASQFCFEVGQIAAITTTPRCPIHHPYNQTSCAARGARRVIIMGLADTYLGSTGRVTDNRSPSRVSVSRLGG